MAGVKGMRRTHSQGLRARAWWCMRKNKRMTLAEILLTLNDNDQTVPERNLQIYLNALCKVQILKRERIADGKPTSNGVYLYILLRDVGRKNPVLRADGVYDPNSKTVLYFELVDLLKDKKMVLGAVI
jgi:hypothetical protein